MSEDPTLPPHQPNTFRTWLPLIGAWLWAHPGAALPLAVVAGFLLGKIL